MDRAEVRALLDAVASGEMSISAAESALADVPFRGFTDLGFARLDTHRALRTGDPEVGYAAGKTTAQVVELLTALTGQRDNRAAVATRLSDEMLAAVADEFP